MVKPFEKSIQFKGVLLSIKLIEPNLTLIGTQLEKNLRFQHASLRESDPIRLARTARKWQELLFDCSNIFAIKPKTTISITTPDGTIMKDIPKIGRFWSVRGSKTDRVNPTAISIIELTTMEVTIVVF